MPSPSTPPADPGPVQLVWLKRDLRLHDHGPLCRAAARAESRRVYEQHGSRKRPQRRRRSTTSRAREAGSDA